MATAVITLILLIAFQYALPYSSKDVKSIQYVNADGFVDYAIRVMKRDLNQQTENEFQFPDSVLQVTSDDGTYDVTISHSNVTDLTLLMRMGEVDVTQDENTFTLATTLRYPLIPIALLFSAAAEGEEKYNGRIALTVVEADMLTGLTVSKNDDGSYKGDVDYVRVTDYGTADVEAHGEGLPDSLAEAIQEALAKEYQATFGDLIAVGVDMFFEEAVTSIDPTSYFS